MLTVNSVGFELELGNGTQRALAATVAVATSTAMWEKGELSQAEYVNAVMLGNYIATGSVPVIEGLAGMMRLWMDGFDALRVDGF